MRKDMNKLQKEVIQPKKKAKEPCDEEVAQMKAIQKDIKAMQAELPEKQRQANVRGAFQVNTKVTPKHVVLVDDVLTTGQTLRSAAKTLKQAGVERVDVAVFARSGG